jgi:hypothetical protein
MDVAIACPCPPKADGEPRHERDTVVFRDRFDYHAGTTTRMAVAILRESDPDVSFVEVLATLREHYLLFGIAAWTLVDDKNKSVPVTKGAIRQFMEDHPDIAEEIAETGEGLYSEQVILPLALRAKRSSPPSPTEALTSAPEAGDSPTKTTSRSSSKTRKSRTPSKRSSTTTSRTAGTGTITRLPVGDASSSLRSATAS